MAARKNYTARFERDEDGWWVVTVPELPGCHTQARSIAQGERRIREALAAVLDDDKAAAAATFTQDIRAPRELARVAAALVKARAKQAAADRETLRLTDAAVALIDESGLSVRDAARVLGVSFQRVQQLMTRKAS